MTAMLLNNAEVVAMSVFVVRAFMQMREQLLANASVSSIRVVNHRGFGRFPVLCAARWGGGETGSIHF
jgi:hypothetical protein